jgi:hypothetical protein
MSEAALTAPAPVVPVAERRAGRGRRYPGTVSTYYVKGKRQELINGTAT